MSSCKTSFYCCYILESKKLGCKNHTYIGSTPDPLRRLRQHNGEIKCGAKKTSKKRPWEIAVFVFGFTNKYAALQFEWAWQHPEKSRHLKKKNAIPTHDPITYKYFSSTDVNKLRFKMVLLYEMLTNTYMWSRWPLKLFFTKQEYLDLFLELSSNYHLKLNRESHLSNIDFMVDDLISVKQLTQARECDKNSVKFVEKNLDFECCICLNQIEMKNINTWLTCTNHDCKLIAHIVCLAKQFLQNEVLNNKHLIPINGKCPVCNIELIWGELVLKQQIIYERFASHEEKDDVFDDSDENSSNDDDNIMICMGSGEDDDDEKERKKPPRKSRSKLESSTPKKHRSVKSTTVTRDRVKQATLDSLSQRTMIVPPIINSLSDSESSFYLVSE